MQALIRLFGAFTSVGFVQKARARLRLNVGDRCKHALEAEWVEPQRRFYQAALAFVASTTSPRSDAAQFGSKLRPRWVSEMSSINALAVALSVGSTPHQSATRLAIVNVTFFILVRSTDSSKP